MKQSKVNNNAGCIFSLASTIASMGLTYGCLMSMGAANEKVSVARGLFITSLGFVFFISFTNFCNKFLLETTSGHKFRHKYNLLRSDAMDITNKIVSAVQALLSCIAGYIVCNSSCRESFMHASHYMSDSYAWFGAAYFLYDMWAMYEVHMQKIADKLQYFKKQSNGSDSNGGGAADENKNTEQEKYDKIQASNELGDDNVLASADMLVLSSRVEKFPTKRTNFLTHCLTHPVMTIHHVFLASFGLLVIVYLRGNFGDCVYSFVYLMEISTPFVSMRGILSTLGLKDTKLYVINGLVMLISFFFCRILMWPYLYHWYSEIKNVSMIEAIWSLPRSCKIGTLIILLPQVYWFYLMVRGAIKVFLPSTKQRSKTLTRNKKD